MTNPHNLPKEITEEHITIQSKLLIHSSPYQCTDTVLTYGFTKTSSLCTSHLFQQINLELTDTFIDPITIRLAD